MLMLFLRLFQLIELKKSDYLAFVAANALGIFLALHYFPAEAFGGNRPLLTTFLSYHFFLFWLLISSDQCSLSSLGMLATLAYHASFLAIAAGLTHCTQMIPGRASLVASSCIIPLAIFEKAWLFSGGKRAPDTEPKASPRRKPAPKHAAAKPKSEMEHLLSIRREDYSHWLLYKNLQPDPFPRPGMTLLQEYELWRSRNEEVLEAARTGRSTLR